MGLEKEKAPPRPLWGDLDQDLTLWHRPMGTITRAVGVLVDRAKGRYPTDCGRMTQDEEGLE